MATLVVAIVCIALIVVGGMTLSQGILTSADAAALSFEDLSVREGEMMRTDLTGISASMPSSDTLLAEFDNSGQVKLSNYDRWDFIVNYYDSSDIFTSTWMPYIEGTPGDNEWRKTGLYLDGAPEAFEPDILNPQEEMDLEAILDPPAGYRAVKMTVVTPNGIDASLVCGPPTLTAHSETVYLDDDYYMLKGWAPSDGTAVTETTPNIPRAEIGRWPLFNPSDPTMPARHLFPLSQVNEIEAGTWTIYYRGQADGRWWGGVRGDAYLNIDVIIRQANGSVREVIDTIVGNALLANHYSWETVSASYNFPGYTVVDDTDYLEIAYYGTSTLWGPSSQTAHILLRVDDSGLSVPNQTRITGLSWS
jgi:hypothetical protein